MLLFFLNKSPVDWYSQLLKDILP